MHDPLEGYRGRDPDMAEVERGLRERVGPENEHLVSTFTLGLDMERFITQSLAGKHLFDRAQTQLATALFQLTECNDLTGEDAKKAHYDARVANAIVVWIQEAIKAGKEAQTTITSQSEER